MRGLGFGVEGGDGSGVRRLSRGRGPALRPVPGTTFTLRV